MMEISVYEIQLHLYIFLQISLSIDLQNHVTS